MYLAFDGKAPRHSRTLLNYMSVDVLADSHGRGPLRGRYRTAHKGLRPSRPPEHLPRYGLVESRHRPPSLWYKEIIKGALMVTTIEARVLIIRFAAK